MLEEGLSESTSGDALWGDDKDRGNPIPKMSVAHCSPRVHYEGEDWEAVGPSPSPWPSWRQGGWSWESLPSGGEVR